MKKYRIHILFSLIIVALTTYTLSVGALVPNDDDRCYISQQGPVKMNRERYNQGRLMAISNAAKLTKAEQEFVSTKLQEYDDIKFECWVKKHQILEKIEIIDDNDNDLKLYQEYIKELTAITNKQHQAQIDLFNSFAKELGAKKALKAYEGYHDYKVAMGKQLRNHK